jgi:C_GCAxxG_C_C family probable redox protein
MTDLTKEVQGVFPDSLNCAQTVLTIMYEKRDLQISNPEYLVAGFGGGIGVQGEVCGAVAGAVIAIGVLVARKEKDILEHKKTAYGLAAKFLKKFKENYSTAICSELLGYDITDSKLREENRPLFEKECPKFVVKAIEILLEMFPE